MWFDAFQGYPEEVPHRPPGRSGFPFKNYLGQVCTGSQNYFFEVFRRTLLGKSFPHRSFSGDGKTTTLSIFPLLPNHCTHHAGAIRAVSARRGLVTAGTYHPCLLLLKGSRFCKGPGDAKLQSALTRLKKQEFLVRRPIFFRKLCSEPQKKGPPWLFRVYLGDEEATQLCGVLFHKTTISVRIPIKQPVLHGKYQSFFFRGSCYPHLMIFRFDLPKKV